MSKDTYITPNGPQPLDTLIDMIRNPEVHRTVAQGDIVNMFRQLKTKPELQAATADFIMAAPKDKYKPVVIRHIKKWQAKPAKKAEQIEQVIKPAPAPAPLPIETAQKRWDVSGALAKDAILYLLRTGDVLKKIRITIRKERPIFWPTIKSLTRMSYVKLACDKDMEVCLQKISMLNKEAVMNEQSEQWTTDCRVIEINLDLSMDTEERMSQVSRILHGFIADMEVVETTAAQ